MSRYDAIVIGAGHNGLTAAAYLARAKRRVDWNTGTPDFPTFPDVIA